MDSTPATRTDRSRGAVGEPIRRRRPGGLLAVLGTGLFGLGLAVGSYGEFTRVLVADGISPDRAGFGMTLFLFGQLLAVLPADRWTRTRSVRSVAAVGFGLGAVGAAIPVLDAGAAAVIGSRLLLGLGQGMAFVGAMKYVGRRTAPEFVASAQGTLGALFTLGLVFAIAASPSAVEQGGFALPAGVAAVVTFAGALGIGHLPGLGRERVLPLVDYVRPFRSASGLVLGLGNMVTFGFLMVATTWYTAVFDGIPTVPVMPALVGFAVVTVIGRLLGGFLAVRLGAARVVGSGLVVLAVSLGGFAYGVAIGSGVLLVLATVGTALGFSVPFGPLFGLAFSELTADAGVTLVVMLALGNAGALAYPWAIGVLLAGTDSYAIGFALLSVTAVVVAGLWWRVVGFGSTPK